MRTRPSRASDLPGREWRQFTLLTRDSWRRLLQSLVFARDADPLQFLLWGGALAVMPTLATAASRMLAYSAIAASSAPPAVLASLVMRDRLFFVIYSMLAAALLAALIWDALFPDRTDQEIIGVLPVRPRTLAAARLTAAVGLALAFAAALAVPAGLFYGFAQLSVPWSGGLVRVVAAHVAATMSASMCVFLALMAFRGLVSVLAGERVAARIAVALQLITVLSFVELFLFLPGVLAALGRQLLTGVDGPTAIPLVWFTAIYLLVAEGQTAWLAPAALGLAVTVAAALFVTLFSLLPAAWIGRRVLEASPRQRAGVLMIVARGVASASFQAPPVRGMFLFAIASLMRSRRHALVLATYLGLATAISVVQLISASYSRRGVTIDAPTAAMLTVPMVFVFFAVFALRSAFAIPTDVDANWPFRLAPPTARRAVGVTRRLMLALGVVPIAAIWLAGTSAIWTPWPAVVSSLFVLASGMALVEFALGSWTKVPFAAAHEPAAVTLRSRWPLFIIALHLFGFLLAEAQRDALGSTRATLSYLGIAMAITAGLRLRREYNLRRETPTFDPVDAESSVVLNLSEAAN